MVRSVLDTCLHHNIIITVVGDFVGPLGVVVSHAQHVCVYPPPAA